MTSGPIPLRLITRGSWREHAALHDALRAFDRATGAPNGAVHAFPYTMPFTQGSAAMLNDVCRSPDDALYVTDTGLTLDDWGTFVPIRQR